VLYVEAVLYVTVAAAAFGLGYLAGRGGSSAAGKEDADVQHRVPVEGKVSFSKRGEAGAVVIALPASKFPDKRLPIAGLRPGDRQPAGNAALASFGGASALTDASGNFTLFVPAAGTYHILALARQVGGDPGAPKQRDLLEMAKYFESTDELLRGCRYDWRTRELRLDTGLIEVDSND
jgi:hypothetical protein